MKIKGAAQFQKKLKDAGRAFEGLDQELANVTIEKADGGQSAISVMEQMIDGRMNRFPGNAMVRVTGDGLKKTYAQMIRAKAAE